MNVPFLFEQRDLAPGDQPSATFDWTDFQAVDVSNPDDPDFERLYQVLAEEFCPRQEMESREVIRQRLSWSLAEKRAGLHMRYRMIAVEKGGRLAGVHDHTVTLKEPPCRESACIFRTFGSLQNGVARVSRAGCVPFP